MTYRGNRRVYFRKKIDDIFKLLDMREKCNPTILVYLESKINELNGAMVELGLEDDPDFAGIIMTLSSFRTLIPQIYDNPTDENCSLYRREVLKCTNLIESKYLKP